MDAAGLEKKMQQLLIVCGKHIFQRIQHDFPAVYFLLLCINYAMYFYAVCFLMLCVFSCCVLIMHLLTPFRQLHRISIYYIYYIYNLLLNYYIIVVVFISKH